MVWKSISLMTNCESPAVVVLSGSMEPAFYRGDVLFLGNSASPIQVGEIVVYKVDDKPIPIVHRVMRVHTVKKTGKQYLLTKGDNNNVDDRGLYAKNQLWVEREHIFGRVYGFAPYVGMVTIIMSDYPQLKFALLGLLCILSLFED
ncbi:Signal peptidase complex catalytic subunit SEC11C [Smittium culicis]|uniref:Signal peptidase complex catalytic subunit SEC11 n=1 Tax=Smittium culicis TaxID=133412 RepID=A0A1R1YU70_9FUNG|nr:Signal peptidase complex catalytic subunit SEC11C [Smittium culicis]